VATGNRNFLCEWASNNYPGMLEKKMFAANFFFLIFPIALGLHGAFAATTDTNVAWTVSC